MENARIDRFAGFREVSLEVQRNLADSSSLRALTPTPSARSCQLRRWSQAALCDTANHSEPRPAARSADRTWLATMPESIGADYRVATATPLAAFAISEATAFGCET